MALHGGLLAVYDEVAEAVVAVELVHGVADFSVAVIVHVDALSDSGRRGERGPDIELPGRSGRLLLSPVHTAFIKPEHVATCFSSLFVKVVPSFSELNAITD